MNEQQTYALPIMLGCAVGGGLLALGIETVLGGADPAFAAALGGALGGVFGRAVWRRRRDAAQHAGADSFGRSMALLVTRIIACGLLGIAIVGSLRGASGSAVALPLAARVLLGVAGAVGLVLTSAAEAKRVARLRDRATHSNGAAHGA